MTTDIDIKYLIVVWFIAANTCVKCFNFVQKPLLSYAPMPFQLASQFTTTENCKSCIKKNYIRPMNTHGNPLNNHIVHRRYLTHYGTGPYQPVDKSLLMNSNVRHSLPYANYYPPSLQQHRHIIDSFTQLHRKIIRPQPNKLNVQASRRTEISNHHHESDLISRNHLPMKTLAINMVRVPEKSIAPVSGPKTICIQKPVTSTPVYITTENTISSVQYSTFKSIDIVYTTESERSKESRSANTSIQDVTVYFSTNTPSPEESNSTFLQALDRFERSFYNATFFKLSSICPPDRRENGISFVLSGLFLNLILNALTLEADQLTKAELNRALDFSASNQDRILTIESVLNMLPISNEELKFRWSTRLVVNGSEYPIVNTEQALGIRVDTLNGTETSEQLTNILNHMVEEDSGGAMRNTFEEDELLGGVRAVLLNTLYVRARWRANPTLLNGTWAFRDADDAPPRSTRMIRINDVMRYADLLEWDAEALEISYSTPGLSLLLLVPRGRSLRTLSERAAAVSLDAIFVMMKSVRVAATLPIYTLRMTLLLPNKLEAMGIERLVDNNDSINNATATVTELRLSHAVQRIMFWAEAGRNAYKDDGIEWDYPPELSMVVDRPYLFYVRWNNLTLMNGNFVL